MFLHFLLCEINWIFAMGYCLKLNKTRIIGVTSNVNITIPFYYICFFQFWNLSIVTCVLYLLFSLSQLVWCFISGCNDGTWRNVVPHTGREAVAWVDIIHTNHHRSSGISSISQFSSHTYWSSGHYVIESALGTLQYLAYWEVCSFRMCFHRTSGSWSRKQRK